MHRARPARSPACLIELFAPGVARRFPALSSSRIERWLETNSCSADDPHSAVHSQSALRHRRASADQQDISEKLIFLPRSFRTRKQCCPEGPAGSRSLIPGARQNAYGDRGPPGWVEATDESYKKRGDQVIGR